MSGFAEVWGQVALAVTWQLAVLALVALVAERLLKLREPRVRHGLWWFVLLAPFVLTPGRMVLEGRGQRVSVPILPAQVEQWDTSARAAFAPYVTVHADDYTPELLPSGKPVDAEAINLQSLLLAVWLGGVALCLVRLGVGWWQVRGLMRKSRPIRDEGLTRALVSLCARGRGTGESSAAGERGSRGAGAVRGVAAGSGAAGGVVERGHGKGPGELPRARGGSHRAVATRRRVCCSGCSKRCSSSIPRRGGPVAAWRRRGRNCATRGRWLGARIRTTMRRL